MKSLLAAALIICFAAQCGKALAYACNNNYYVNSSGHVLHSPSCGQEHEKRTAECRDGSVSFFGASPRGLLVPRRRGAPGLLWMALVCRCTVARSLRPRPQERPS